MKENTIGQSRDWPEVQKQILRYLENVLFRIEWNYGDCRAPFKYPPTFDTTELNDGSFEYQCTIQLDFGDNELLIFKSINPHKLFTQIKNDIEKRFCSTISKNLE